MMTQLLKISFLFAIWSSTMAEAKSACNEPKEFGLTFQNTHNGILWAKVTGFSRFEQIDFECLCAVSANQRYEGASLFIFSFYLSPDSLVRLTRSFDLKDLVLSTSLVHIHFEFIDGLVLGPFRLIDLDQANFTSNIFFGYSKLDFYLHNGSLIVPALCDAELFKDYEVGLFTNLQNSYVTFFPTTSYAHPICPFGFKNANLMRFYVANLRDDRVVQNVFRFSEITNTRNISINLNSVILNLEFSNIYRLKIDSNLVHPLVFHSVQELVVDGTIEMIQTDLFRSLPMLRKIRIHLNNMREFFHASDNKWISAICFNCIEFASQNEMENSNETFNGNELARFFSG